MNGEYGDTPQEEAQGGVSWGKMLLGAAAVTGIAVAGVGLWGDKLAEWIGSDTAVGKWLAGAQESITGTASAAGEKAASAAENVKEQAGKAAETVKNQANKAVEGARNIISGGNEASTTTLASNTPPVSNPPARGK